MRFATMTFVIAICFPHLLLAQEADQSWSYRDYLGQIQTATMKIENSGKSNQKRILELSDFDRPIELTNDDVSAYSNPNIPSSTEIFSKSQPGVKLSGVEVSKNSLPVADVKNRLAEFRRVGSLEISADELCPANAERVLVLVIRDFAALPFCLTKKE